MKPLKLMQLCRTAFCPRYVTRGRNPHCWEHQPPAVICSTKDCTRELRYGNKSGKCAEHWQPLDKRICAKPGCSRRLSIKNRSGLCIFHYDRAEKTRKPPAPPQPVLPTKLSTHRLEYLRLYYKTHPRGPLCTGPGCTTRLRQPTKTKLPLCMECRVKTGQLARVLAKAERPKLERGWHGLFLPKKSA